MPSLNRKFSFIIFLIAALASSRGEAQTLILLEAENGNLLGNATVVNCSSASNNKMVNGIGSGGIANALRLQGISIPEAGSYFITVSYVAVNAPTIHYQVNGGATNSVEAPASGLWCYQGGGPADVTFETTLDAGSNTLLFFNSPIIDKVTVTSELTRQVSTFFISSSSGNDNNDGLSAATPWKSLEKINALGLLPGDTLLLKKGDIFVGQLVLRNESGTAERPIVVTNYGNGERPVIDGNGFLSALYVQNSGFIHISGLELKNDGGPSQDGEPTNLRYGLYFHNTYNDGTIFEHFRVRDVIFKNIYPTEMITDNDQTGVHAYGLNTSGSWGDDLNPTRFDDMLIEDCLFTRTGRHALRIVATNGLVIRNNLFEHVGGAGMVIGANSSNILVERNTTNYTGSNLDPRMAARGSGIWCFRTKNLTVQNNQFMHARGIKDSFGMHIDIGNKNVVYQYNYSEDNEGGFVEVLGANVNVGYRYNISIGDGWRSRGTQLGRIFWIGGWSGTVNAPIASDSVFIYNNSVFVPTDIAPRIWIEAVTQNTRIYNNIVHAQGGLGQIFIKNDPSYNDFDHNLWFGDIEDIDDDGDAYQGGNALSTDPLFSVFPPTLPQDFILQNESLATRAGKLIYEAAVPQNHFESHGGKDYFGNPVSPNLPPSIGAFNIQEVVGAVEADFPLFKLYPSLLKVGQNVNIELPDQLENQALQLQLLSSSGDILLQKAYSHHRLLQVEIPDLPQGLYYIQIQAKSYQSSQKVIIID